MEVLTLRGQLRRLLPSWLRDRPWIQKTTGFRILWTVALVLDASLQMMIEGVRAAFPTLGTPTALPYHGRDRRMFRGPFQTDEQYAIALLEWLDLWRAAGGPRGLARALQLYLDPNAPVIRVVNRNGFWVTLNADGSRSYYRAPVPNWDWDSISNPSYAASALHARDVWVIVYEPHFPTDGVWGDPGTWGDVDANGDAQSFGQATTTANAEQIAALIHQMKGAAPHVHTVIWSYDDTAFDPTSAPGAAGMPDGYWGKYKKVVGGVAVPSRREDCRYMDL